ncbi:hypothetical protein C4F49_03650 [Sphingobacterium sp. KB22]|uniref:Uncharacterized protein n=1 Tax=Sphingobacterium hungaricum TaxID=2082723 RepID=A0A928YQ92_9SPHI|nr:hypothetical protein [Sphingobacterium hungaricum]
MGNKISIENQLSRFEQYDFSSVWLASEEETVYGILTDDYQRIQIKFTSIIKNTTFPNHYSVTGKSNVAGNIGDFSGEIIVDTIQQIVSENWGVDDEYKDKGIIFQGLLTGNYYFKETLSSPHAGSFEGTLKSLFLIDKDNQVAYNAIDMISDGYFNNAFVGTWTLYGSEKPEICNWGDYRVPYSKCDFDIGSGEFSVSDTYLKNGWENLKNN